MSFQLGERVQYGAIISKVQSENTTYVRTELPKPEVGVVVGKRTVRDYYAPKWYTEPSDPDGWGQPSSVMEPPVAIPDTKKTVYIVSFNLYRKPILVHEDDLRSVAL